MADLWGMSNIEIALYARGWDVNRGMSSLQRVSNARMAAAVLDAHVRSGQDLMCMDEPDKYALWYRVRHPNRIETLLFAPGTVTIKSYCVDGRERLDKFEPIF